MATIKPTVLITNDGVVLASWTPVTESDVCGVARIGRFADKTVQVTGTLGSSPNIEVHGSNDATTFGNMHDAQGVDIGIGDNQPVLIAENCEELKPVIQAGTGVSVTITISASARGR